MLPKPLLNNIWFGHYRHGWKYPISIQKMVLKTQLNITQTHIKKYPLLTLQTWLDMLSSGLEIPASVATNIILTHVKKYQVWSQQTWLEISQTCVKKNKKHLC